MEAPVVTLVRPADKLYTKESTVTLQAEVVDTGAGVDQGDIVLVATAGVNLPGQQDQLKSPVASGFSVTGVPTAGIGEGAQKWAVLVTDKVGNTPAVDEDGADKCTGTGADEKCGSGPIGVNEGARGAAAPETAIGQVDNAFVFTVDTTGSDAGVNGKTGVSSRSRTPGVTSADADDKEIGKGNAQARVGPDHLRSRGSVLPQSGCLRQWHANDFRVGGEVPTGGSL